MGILLYLTILPLLNILPCSYASSQSTLSTGSSLSVEQHEQTFLTSPNGNFSCGFYKVGGNAFAFSIWFTNTAEKTIVWSANPKSPVNGRGSVVSLNHNGNLVLTDVNGSVTWDSKTSSGKGTTVTLLDTGNLIIKESTGAISWESFSLPTDTLLPLQPLTKGTRLVSGYYNLYFDNDNVLRLMYDGPEISSIYWPSAEYTVFQNGRTSYNSSRIAVLDTQGYFLSSDGLNIKASDWGTGIQRRLTIDYDGNLRMYSLSASNGSWIVSWEAVAKICDVHGLCGQNGICENLPNPMCSCPPGYEMVDPQNWNRGCQPQFSKNCSKKEEFEFIKLPQTDFYGFDLTYNQSVTLEACKKTCLDICSCSALTYKTGSGLCYTKAVLFNGFSSPDFPGDNYMKVPKNMASKQSVLTCKLGFAEIVKGSALAARRGHRDGQRRAGDLKPWRPPSRMGQLRRREAYRGAVAAGAPLRNCAAGSDSGGPASCLRVVILLTFYIFILDSASVRTSGWGARAGPAPAVRSVAPRQSSSCRAPASSFPPAKQRAKQRLVVSRSKRSFSFKFLIFV